MAWEFNQHAGTDPDIRKTQHAKAATVKLAASEVANRVIDRCAQIFGGWGGVYRLLCRSIDPPAERVRIAEADAGSEERLTGLGRWHSLAPLAAA